MKSALVGVGILWEEKQPLPEATAGTASAIFGQGLLDVAPRWHFGASKANILRLILWEGGRLIALGGLAGLGTALALSRFLKSLLLSIGPYDPLSFISVALLSTLVALAATLIPCRAAMNVDPMVALRHE